MLPKITSIFIMILLPPTLLCKALSVWFWSRMLSPRSCNLQALRVLSKVIVMWALYNHSIKACMQYISECKMNNHIKWKVLRNPCKSHLIHNSVEMKISSNLQRNFVCYAMNYLDLRELLLLMINGSMENENIHMIHAVSRLHISCQWDLELLR